MRPATWFDHHIQASEEERIDIPADEVHGVSAEEQPLDSRKLQYLRLAYGKEPRSQISVKKLIYIAPPNALTGDCRQSRIFRNSSLATVHAMMRLTARNFFDPKLREAAVLQMIKHPSRPLALALTPRPKTGTSK